MRVCIDPGHGGRDPGAVGYVVEKDVALLIADYVVTRLREHRIAVTWTRALDQYVGLDERVRIANECSADCFVSIHCNASKVAGTGSGFESFCFPGSTEGAKLQSCIHTAIGPLFAEYRIQGRALEAEPVKIPLEIGAQDLELLVHDRGQKAANFYVLRETKMPAVLLECLFVDNSRDAELLQDQEFVRWLGYGIAEGVAAYLGVQAPEPKPEYICSPQHAEAVRLARQKGLSNPGPGHDYTKPLSEERFWEFIRRIERW